jgi:hypothetical protein
MIDIPELTANERAKHYRKLAADARREAELANETVRESYIPIAERWERPADAEESDAARRS